MTLEKDLDTSIAETCQMEGRVESLTRWGATGWAWIPADPDLLVTIEADLNGQVVGRAVASQVRPDLIQLGKRSGYCSFSLVFDAPLEDHSVPELRATYRGGSSILPGVEIAPVAGSVDRLTHSAVMGWVWMPGEPERALQVEALLDDTVIGRTTANQLRPDILASGRGTGRYGFSIAFERPLDRGKALRIRALGPGESTPLNCPEQPEQFEGFVDGLTSWGATGWAWNPDNPDEVIRVEATLNGEVIASSLANQMRADLVERGTGAGRHGFTLNFSPALNEKSLPVIRAIGDGLETTLTGAAWSSVDGAIDSLSRWGAIGWAWMPSDPGRSLQIEVVLEGRIIGTALADMARQDIASSGRGTGNYGFTLGFDEPISSDRTPEFRVVGAGEIHVLRNSRESAIAPHDAAVALAPSPEPPPSPPPATATASFGPSILGAVDRLTRWGATGWACTPGNPEQALLVEAVLDGRVIGSSTADQMRPDLAEHGKGTGRYGFVLGFNEPVAGQELPLIRVAGAEGPTVLPCPEGSIHEFGERAATPSPPVSSPSPASRPSSSLKVEGYVDVLTRRDATGWAWLPGAPNKAVQIEAVLNGKVIGRGLADQPRADLLKHGKGTGQYGFKVAFEEPILGSDLPEIRGLLAVGEPLSGPSALPALRPTDTLPRGTVTSLFRDHAAFTSAGPEYEDFDSSILAKYKSKKQNDQQVELIAFYLPQYHPIPENDQFWGKGFTEWRQLPKGLPRFPGHYQPRIPRDLGFYDLEDVENLSAQTKLAKAAGITAFAFYYYWFNGKRVLDRPLELLLKSDINLPFLLIWANENWTRTWDGMQSQVLLKQDYSADDDEALVGDLARHFSDDRYFRLDGRPLFVIYNPKNIPNSAATIEKWRGLLKTQHGLNPLIFMAQTFGERDPTAFGLDGAIEFPPHKLADTCPGRSTPDAYSKEFAGRVIPYEEFVSASLDADESPFPLIKTIVPSWDNDARRPNRGLALEGSSPKKYQSWLQELISRALDSPVFGTPVVMINAWNEWAECAYLEPDVYYGSSYLNATARARVLASDARRLPAATDAGRSQKHRVTVIFPNFNHSKYLRERISSVLSQTVLPAEIIFLDDCSSDDSLVVAKDILSHSSIPYRIVANTVNSGGVFRQWVKGLDLAENNIIWVAETDDSVDPRFLEHVLPAFDKEHVMACYGRIACIDQSGAARKDLDGYLDGLRDFSWNSSRVVAAYRAFSHDFSIKNVIPNASGLVFRKPRLTPAERDRLFQYRFAGDWYFYALVIRGGSVAYSSRARSLFRINQSSTSRSAFFTERHLAEHQMVISDLTTEYGISSETVDAHADGLARLFTQRSAADIRTALQKAREGARQVSGENRRLRLCIAAHSFAVGGGEVLPLELANEMKSRGCHVTYLVLERAESGEKGGVRARLRPDIPVVYWPDVLDRFASFVSDYGIDVINSHNVGVEYHFFKKQIKLDIPYVASLHGGYETVPDMLTPSFVSYVNGTVSRWLYLANKNVRILEQAGVSNSGFQRSFNAIPALRESKIQRADFVAEHGIDPRAFIFVICSRAIREKGWQVAIDAMLEASHSLPRKLHLVLIGDGPALADLKSANSNSNCLTFMGHVDNPARYFGCFEAGIFPSTYSGETFPLFLLECFQAGLPVISSDIGEIPIIMGAEPAMRPGAIVNHLAPEKAMVSEIAKLIAKLTSDDHVYETMRANAHAASDRFSMRALADLYGSVLSKLTGKQAAIEVFN